MPMENQQQPAAEVFVRSVDTVGGIGQRKRYRSLAAFRFHFRRAPWFDNFHTDDGFERNSLAQNRF
jgi:hypothetical protein